MRNPALEIHPFTIADTNSAPAPSSLDLMINSLLDGTQMPMTMPDELNPTRWVVKAKTDNHA